MDINEFKETVVPWQRVMFAAAIRTGLSAADAADAVQEAFIALWRCRQRLDSIDDIKLYCLRTVHNASIDIIRHHHDNLSIDKLTAEPAAEPPQTAMSSENVGTLLRALPEKQRTVMKLSLFEQLDNREIAAATGISEANVRQLLCRARKFLRSHFKQ